MAVITGNELTTTSVQNVSSTFPATTTIVMQTTTSEAAATTTIAASTEITSSTTTTASSSSLETNLIVIKSEKSAPIIKTRLQKFAVTSGKPFKQVIPEGTFYDNEDFSNLRLDISDRYGHALKENSWLQFNPDTKELYGL